MLMTAPSRAPQPPLHLHALPPDKPLVAAAVDETTVTVVLATRPGPSLRDSDRRRLRRALDGARRRLRHSALDGAGRRQLAAQLERAAAAIEDLPVGDGIALVASSGAARVLHLRQPVRARTLVGPAPSRLEVAEAVTTLDRVAVLGLTLDRARLLVADGGVLGEVVAHGLPVRRPRDRGLTPLLLPDYLAAVEAAVAAALPAGTPLVVAGDERVAAAFAERRLLAGGVAAVLPGDHAGTSPLALLALARRRLDDALTPGQRRALAAVAVADADGRVSSGLAALVAATGDGSAGLLVVERGVGGGQSEGGPVAAAAAAMHAHGGRVVTVPEGRLAAHGRVVLVRDGAPTTGEVGR